MKNNILFLVSLCSLVLLSCQKEDIEAPSVEDRTYTYTFAGSCGTPDTKISVGDKTEAGWPIKWTGGDVIAVFKEGVSEKLGLPKLGTDYAGKTHGVFTLDSSEQYEGNVVIAHPGSATYTAEGLLSGEVPSEQEVIKAGNSGHIGKSGLAYAKAVMSGTDVPSDFVLNHLSAYVRLVLRTEEFAGHTLTGATLWCKGTSLAGTISVNVNDGTLSTTGTGDYVKSYVRSGNAAAFGNESVLWFSTLPVDLTGKSLYVIVHMTRNDGATVTVPVEITGGNLKAGSVNSITIKDLRTSSAPAWYETVETRYIAAYGEGWSYGPANCFVGYMNEPFTFDVKARGNFMKCVEPAALQVAYACCHNASNKKNLYFGATCAFDDSSYITYDLGRDYIVEMKAGAAGSYTGYSSKVLLLDAAGNTIWAFNVWGNKEKLVEHTLTKGTILDRNIGSTNHDTDYYRAGSFFQWGRPFNIEWGSTFYTKGTTPVESLALSAANPTVAYYNNSGTQNWYAGPEGDGLNDLWGNDQASSTEWTAQVGAKSIYDPCPKGYMVASPAVLDEIKQNSTVVEAESGSKSYKWLNYGDVYIPFAGGKWVDGGNTSNAASANALLWSNSSYNTTGRSYGIGYSTKWGNVYHSRAAAYSVRCMVDTENR